MLGLAEKGSSGRSFMVVLAVKVGLGDLARVTTLPGVPMAEGGGAALATRSNVGEVARIERMDAEAARFGAKIFEETEGEEQGFMRLPG
mmetsp:Transcript_32163/g.68860  ORF Transcript_32163/g.68860 Transcript_32163/m.68860 type:complete len:89 (-) Transcript_32163:767-1033(-)